VSSGSARFYSSTGTRGYLKDIADHPLRIVARKFEREVQVRFADHDCIVHTPEGEVHARSGDAILTGIAGEHWRVSRAHFGDKYRPLPPTRSGEPGTYVSLPNRILALQMNEAFEVLLADKVSRLKGRAGDWLVDYGDGSLGVVTEPIFAVTYEIMD
jgi:PGDYG protein